MFLPVCLLQSIDDGLTFFSLQFVTRQHGGILLCSYRVMPFPFRSIRTIVRNILRRLVLWDPFYLPLVPNLIRNFANQCLVCLFNRGHSAILCFTSCTQELAYTARFRTQYSVTIFDTQVAVGFDDDFIPASRSSRIPRSMVILA